MTDDRTDAPDPDGFGDPAQLPALQPLRFLGGAQVDRVTSLVMTLAAEVWSLREALAEHTGAQRPDEQERRAYVRRLLDALAPEPDPARPIRQLADREPSGSQAGAR